MADIELAVDVEFDGTGQPTGNALCNGVKYTGVLGSEVGSIPRVDGKTTTKVWVIHRVIVQDVATIPIGTTFTIYDRGNQKKRTAGIWTKV